MEDQNVVVTEIEDGSYTVSEVPAEEFEAAEYVSNDNDQISIGGLIPKVIGVGATAYAAYKGIKFVGKKLGEIRRTYNAGKEALRKEEVVDAEETQEETKTVIDDPEVRDFCDKRKAEKEDKKGK